MKKTVALLLTAAMSVGMLAGCGGEEATNTPAADTQQAEVEAPADDAASTEAEAEAEAPALSGEIVVASNRTDLEDTLNAYAQTFMDANPGTTVTFEFIKEYDSVIATRVAGGEAPDLFYVVDPINQDTYSEYFLPIDDLKFTADDILFYEHR